MEINLQMWIMEEAVEPTVMYGKDTWDFGSMKETN